MPYYWVEQSKGTRKGILVVAQSEEEACKYAEKLIEEGKALEKDDFEEYSIEEMEPHETCEDF